MDNFIQIRSMRRARDIKEQLSELCERVEIDINDPTISVFEDEYNTNIRKCIASGFFFNASKWYATGMYKTVKNHHTV
jgi:pre-mRNA-splicing factor ATP-dependent RNA helicase DHX16